MQLKISDRTENNASIIFSDQGPAQVSTDKTVAQYFRTEKFVPRGFLDICGETEPVHGQSLKDCTVLIHVEQPNHRLTVTSRGMKPYLLERVNRDSYTSCIFVSTEQLTILLQITTFSPLFCNFYHYRIVLLLLFPVLP